MLILCAIKAATAYGVLFFITMLGGVMVDDLLPNPLRYPQADDCPRVAAARAKMRRALVVSWLLIPLGAIVYIALLLRFWSRGVAVAAVLMLIAAVLEQLQARQIRERGFMGTDVALNRFILGLVWFPLVLVWLSLCGPS